ncbi:MAG TPA: 16S rRNA (adenine(1518)-N(6)/adenine(1519)-N(6))-dimethyltransferase RsmA [Candidatus Paceibacterota bacterium]
MGRKGARLGQHFLKNFAYAQKLAHAAGVGTGNTVIEIGPGKGILTEALLKTGARVIAIEKDETLVHVLEEKFSEQVVSGTLKIVNDDVRNFGLRNIEGEYVLAANIPYYITGEIVRAFLTAEHQPRTMALLVQKEVAQRIVAEKESILSLSVKAYGTPKIVARVNRKHFSPPPSVDSAILVIENISTVFFTEISEGDFFKVVRAGFASKRKMLAGNLARVFHKEKVSAAFAKCEISEKVRAEDVALAGWKCLTATLQEN